MAIVPARGGSKGVPDKNIRLLGGKPLLAWSVELAQATPAIDRVVVSTDSERIAGVARTCGAEVMLRPSRLATDTALVIDAVRDILARLEAAGERPDIVVLLEPTCPFRSSEDITACLNLLIGKGYDSVATFVEAKVHPQRIWKVQGERPTPFIEGAIPWTPRQQLEPALQLSGAVYACRVATFPKYGVAMLYGEMGAVVTPPERSVDIDSPLDLAFANLVAEGLGA